MCLAVRRLFEEVGAVIRGFPRSSQQQSEIEMEFLGKICKALDCNIEDIMEFVGEDDQ